MASTLDRITALEQRMEAVERRASPPLTLEEFQGGLAAIQAQVDELKRGMGYEGAESPFGAELRELSEAVAELQGRSEASAANRSAAKKRPMTDADALEVLTGKYKDLKHKEAGEAIGLSYPQVYSCRCEYTFKEVHHALAKSGWKNPWARTR